MRLPDEIDDHPKMSPSAVYSIIVVSLFIITILVAVLLLNHKGGRVAVVNENTAALLASISEEGQKDGLGGIQEKKEISAGSDLTPDDFDFWDMYPEESMESEAGKEVPLKEQVEDIDPSKDGKHTLLTDTDGKEEWILISPYLTKNEYDLTKLVSQSNLMKYYEDGKKISYVGADISKYQDYVDFVKLKKAGVDFVMIRVGARGYGSGEIMMDSYFADNMKRATDAGLEVGVYFFSQAITKEEAIEEANLVIESIKDYQITYPVVFNMEKIDNDTARIDKLSRDEKTTLTKSFLDTIKAASYKPMVYGNKEWLIKQVDLSKLGNYDIWLSQPGDVPEYPYQFTMWQYTTTATIDGISGYADLSISFIDYSEK